MFSLFLVCGAAMAMDGIRTDGVVPAVGQGGGGVVLTQATPISGGVQNATLFGLTGQIGVAEDIALDLTMGWQGSDLVGGELRVQLPLLGRRDEPRLSLLAGVDTGANLGSLDGVPPWWAVVGVVTGVNLPADFRLHAGVEGDWKVGDGIDGLWFEPAIGASWRPGLGKHLAAVIDLEAAGQIDPGFDRTALGPTLTLGLTGR